MHHIRPLWGLGFSTKSLLSSVAYGDTSFQRKEAKNCGGAATITLAAEGRVKLKNPPARRAGQS